MSLMKRIMEQRLRHQPAPAPQQLAEVVRAPATGPRGSCKAINAETGRQCALLAGHAGAHVHGRTAFTQVAQPGQTTFTRRDALDRAATFHPHQGEVA